MKIEENLKTIPKYIPLVLMILITGILMTKLMFSPLDMKDSEMECKVAEDY